MSVSLWGCCLLPVRLPVYIGFPIEREGNREGTKVRVVLFFRCLLLPIDGHSDFENPIAKAVGSS